MGIYNEGLSNMTESYKISLKDNSMVTHVTHFLGIGPTLNALISLLIYFIHQFFSPVEVALYAHFTRQKKIISEICYMYAT